MNTNSDAPVQKKRRPRFEMGRYRSGPAWLTEDDITEMLTQRLCGGTLRAIAKRFSVSATYVSNVVERRTWQQVPMPDVSKERFERNVLGVKRDVTGAIARANLALSVCLLTGGLVVGPGSILRAVLRMRFWPGAGAAEERRKRVEKRLLLFVGPPPAPKPEPPYPDGPGASSTYDGYRDSGDEAAEEEQEITWPQRPLFGLPPVYPVPLRDWKEPREFRSQAVPLGRGDRAWTDEDVKAIAASKRFQVIVGGRADGGEKRQA